MSNLFHEIALLHEVVVDSNYVKIHLFNLTLLSQTFGIGKQDLFLSKINGFGKEQKRIYEYFLKETAKGINGGKGDFGKLKLIISVIESVDMKTFESSRSIYLKSLCAHASEALVAKGYGKTDEKLWK